MKNKHAELPYIVSRFFTVYLPGERGFSKATIVSYRDTFKQLLSFCKVHLGIPPEKLTVAHLSRDVITEFLSLGNRWEIRINPKPTAGCNKVLFRIHPICFPGIFGCCQWCFTNANEKAA